MNRRRFFRALLIVLIVLTLCFIWGNSLLDREESTEVSTGLLDWLLAHGVPIPSEHVLRKMAHFGEFFALGCELSLLAFLERGIALRPGAVSALAAFLAAAADETLQLFTDRSGQVSDVLLDFSGALTAIVCVSLIGRIIHGKKTSR